MAKKKVESVSVDPEKKNMFQLKNIKTGIPKGGGDFYTAFDLIAVTIEKVSSEGATVGEIRTKIKILEQLESGNKFESVFLKKDEYLFCKNTFNSFKWTIQEKAMMLDILQISDNFNEIVS